MNPDEYAVGEGFIDHLERKKRLGQYYSGINLAKLLCALSINNKVKSAIDPMAGKGDMLQGCINLGIDKNRTYGIEIDPLAYEDISSKNINHKNNFINSNVFDSRKTSRLTSRHWDLVITNPPYVRYQSLKKSAGNSSSIPSGDDVRDGLRSIISKNRDLSEEDMSIFTTLVENYSGLSDLAVPSWILCASMVKKGGVLAMVLPESWLSRDYATPVNYILMRMFDIKYII